MAAFFFDSSAIVKRYLEEPGSDWVLSIVQPPTPHRILLARITSVETTSAIVRAGRSGRLSSGEAALALGRFQYDLTHAYEIIPVTPRVIRHAVNLVEVHGLRAYDAVQLAAALRVQDQRLRRRRSPLTFVSADANLNAAASGEGLPADDPNLHP